MTHYGTHPNHVRVDYFKPSGKWYMTESIDMDTVWDAVDMRKTIGEALDASRPDRHSGWWEQFTVVVLEPYNKNAHPVMIVALG
jgi:hypothetical protein